MKGNSPLQDFTVTLRNCYRTQRYMVVRSCVSPAAACKVADLLQDLNPMANVRYQAVYAFPLYRSLT